MTLEPHPLAELFPMMEGEAFAALVSDIRDNGLREAIVLHEGKILDGRNRYAACAEVGIEPITRPWDQRGDALSYVISKNLNRRHLNESQRAMVAAKIAALRLGSNQHQKADAQICASASLTQTEAAKMMNVSRRSVQDARVVHERGIPELQGAVNAGAASVKAASQIAKQEPELQREIVKRGPAAIAAEASAIRRTRQPANGLSTRRINADVWIRFRDAMESLAGMPLASDMAEVVRGHDKAKVTDRRLERNIRWLADFERAWREISSKAA